MTKPLVFLLCSLLAMALAGCPAEELAEPGARRVTPSPTAGPQAGLGNVSGGLETGGSDVATVRYVSLSPESLVLYAPAADGTAPAGLATSSRMTAEAILSTGLADGRGVTWSVSAPEHLRVAAGQVSVQPGTPAGTYAVTAVAADPAASRTSIVAVKTEGVLRLAVEPAPAPGAPASLNLTQDGRFVLHLAIGATADIRLPAGTGYVAQVQQADESGAELATLPELAITPNGVTAATASLQAVGGPSATHRQP